MDFSKQLQKADEALRRRNYDFAVDLYRSLLDISPDLGEARAGLRQALRKREEKKKGTRLLRAVGGAVPLARAKTMHKLRKHEACAKALEDYLKGNPLDEEANLLLGISLEESGHFNSARAVYEFLADIAPNNPEGLKRAGAMMARTGEPARALQYFERALQADPRDQEALKARKNLAAETALSQTNFESVGHSREQIKDKDQARQLERQQRRHLSDDELREELERLETRYAEDPSNVDVMLELASIHERLKDPAAALDLVERAQSYRKDSYDILCRAGDLRAKALKKRIARAGRDGDEEEANRLERELVEIECEDWRGRVEMRPGDAAARLQLGRRLMRAEAYDEALGELQKANGDPRLQKEAVFLLAQCFHSKGILDLARKQYEQALEATPAGDERTKEILYNLGAIAEAEGDTAAARSNYIRIYEIDIGYRDVANKMEQLK